MPIADSAAQPEPGLDPGSDHFAAIAGTSDLQQHLRFKIKPRITGGTGKTHLSIGLGIRACQAGHRVAFATAAEWVARLADAHAAGKLQDELTIADLTELTS